MAAASAMSLDLADVMRAAPLPVLSTVNPQYFGALYNTAFAATPSPFDMDPPFVPLELFVDRMLKYSDVSHCVLVTALIYLDRFVANTTSVFITRSNVRKLYGVAFMLATKWQEDDFYAATTFSRLMGIPVDELISLEMLFLRAIDYQLFVTSEQLREAEILFMAEAIDSACGLSVFQRLRMYNIDGVDEASDRVKTWHVVYTSACVPTAPMDTTYATTGVTRGPYSTRVHGIAPISLSGDASRARVTPLAHRGYCPTPSNADGARARSISILASLARTQLEHDFPKGTWRNDCLYQANLIYTDGGVMRLHRLIRLSQGAVVSTSLPRLGYRPFTPPCPAGVEDCAMSCVTEAHMPEVCGTQRHSVGAACDLVATACGMAGKNAIRNGHEDRVFSYPSGNNEQWYVNGRYSGSERCGGEFDGMQMSRPVSQKVEYETESYGRMRHDTATQEANAWRNYDGPIGYEVDHQRVNWQYNEERVRGSKQKNDCVSGGIYALPTIWSSSSLF